MVEANYHEESGGYEAMEKLLDLPKPPDAVFAASDPIAIGAMQAVLDADLAIPEQVGLIGVGAHRYSKYLRVPLTPSSSSGLSSDAKPRGCYLTLCIEESPPVPSRSCSNLSS